MLKLYIKFINNNTVKWLFLKIIMSEEWYDCLHEQIQFMKNQCHGLGCVRIASKANTHHTPITKSIMHVQ